MAGTGNGVTNIAVTRTSMEGLVIAMNILFRPTVKGCSLSDLACGDGW